MPFIAPTFLKFRNDAIRTTLSISLCLFAAVFANAQTTSPTDGSTPLALSPGAPAGSFALSGFENVNPYNGNLNFHLPLLGISGRGGAGMAATLEIDALKWNVKDTVVVDPNTGLDTDVFTPSQNWWTQKPGYGPGILIGRQSGSNPTQVCQIQGGGVARNIYWQTLTRFTFTAGDGTEYELRDDLTKGQPGDVPNPCGSGTSRGTVFITADGTAATFISDTTITDKVLTTGGSTLFPSGYLMLRDGTRYRIDGGNVTWLRDRNGNKLSFTYGGSGVSTITDSLNRQVTITYGDMVNTFTDQITYNGFSGTPRTITVTHASLSAAFRADYSATQSFHNLFPELNNASPSNSFNPTVVSAVTLPNGQQYQLRYNTYGELARIVLPTGGAIEYDYNSGSGVLADGSDFQIYRRVRERRVYTEAANTTPEQKTTYIESVSGDSIVTVDHLNSADVLLAREKHYFYGRAANSLFTATGISYAPKLEGREYKTESFAANGATLLRRAETNWANRAAVSWWWSPGDATEPANDVRVIDTTTTLADVSPNLVSKQTFGYDDSVPFNNQNDVKEYDFGSGAPGALIRETSTTFVTDASYTGTSVHLRSLPSQVSVYDGSSALKASSSSEYDNYGSGANHVGLLGRSGISGFDSSFSTSYTARGNVTASTRFLLMNGVLPNCVNSPLQCISGYAQYDIAGNVIKTIDALGHATVIDYSDRFGIPDGEAESNPGPTNLPTGQSSYAFPTKITNAANQIIYSQFDYYGGKPVNSEDPNGIVSTGYYDDSLDRPTQMIRAANDTATPSTKNQTSFAYDDSGRTITVTSDQTAYGDNLLKSRSYYDGLGRTFESRQYEDATSYIATKTEFDALGRAYRTANPYRSGDPILWTTSAFDALGRMTSVTTPDSAAVGTSYAGNTVTVTDQDGKARQSVTDGLGRLKQVYEDPNSLNYLTSYDYDTLDNLITVSQGTQTRTFFYDSLKRLLSATNPESGTICYGTVISSQCQADGYDGNGNLLYKTDARGVRSTYAYDALNRPTARSYSDGTPAVTYTYDSNSITNGTGRLAAVSSSVSTYSYNGYDALGRPSSATETLGSQNYSVGYTYGLAGQVQSMTYPSGRTVSYGYDGAGRASSFAGNLGDGTQRTYSSEIIYSPLGGMTKEKFGTDAALYNKLFYNSRGQLAEIRESTSYTGATDTTWNRGAIINHYSNTCWGMCGGSTSTTSMTDNNGNLKKQDTFIPNNEANTSYTSWSQQYDYDTLNRLQRVHEYTGDTTKDWQQEYSYDRYGNRTIQQDVTKTWGSGINKKDFSVSATNNRLTVPSGQSGTISYDAAGNLTTDTYSAAAVTRAYDAENRMTSETQANSYVPGSYAYDADGRRVKRTVAGQPSAVETWQVYGIGGELLGEYAANASPASPQKEYGYRNGQLLITADAPLTSGTRTNFALASNGASASASSTYSPSSGTGYNSVPAVAINGDRTGKVGSATAFWNDGTQNSGPDWLQVDFSGTKSIDEIDLFTVQDNYTSPGTPTETMTFSAYGLTAYDVQYWDGSAWVTVTGGSITSNNKVWKKLTFTAVSTTKIRVLANSTVDGWSRVAEVEAWGDDTPTNVALSSNGATATASSTYSPSSGTGYSSVPAEAINGDRTGRVSSATSWWNDGTQNSGPDWLQVDFSGSKTIGEIDVFTAQDNYTSPGTPTETMTFSAYGLTAYDVQYWDGSAWVTVTGGSITSNNKVWKKLTFSPITTSKIRVLANATSDGWSRITEVEAWTPATAAPTANINWLVTDQLGTPRMIFDKSGSLATTKRHDYLPFGEELSSVVGLRSSVVGYAVGDTTRQKFTDKERDNETGLDYSINRYYSSIQGRFTSADPIPMTSLRPSDPQLLNLYSYVRNNPLIYTDPNGLELYFELEFDSKGKVKNWSDAKQYKKALEKGTGLKLQIDKTTGKVTIKSEPTTLSGAGSQVKTIIGDTVNTPVRISVSNNDPNVLGGSFGGGGRQTIDLADIGKLSKKGGFTKESAVVHETTEAYEGKNTASGSQLQPAFHAAATGYENDVRAQQGLGARIGESMSSSGNEDTYVVDFTTHTETIVTNAGTGTIKSVKVEKKKP